MKAKILSIFILIIVGTLVYGQNNKQSNVWYFGHGAGLDFNTSPPTVLTDGQLHTSEGCASYSDNSGKILLYTEGDTVWNSIHQVIPGATGLGGNSSCTQAALIVPLPESDSLVYIFSNGANDGSPKNGIGLYYSIIDLSLNGGLGGIIEKKTKILNESSEKLIGIQHCNRKDFWIIAHELKNNKFVIWELTSNGLSMKPTEQNIGSVLYGWGGGYMKPSIDGSKIAVIVKSGSIDVFEFNQRTGLLNELYKIRSDTIFNSYGLAFSPNSNFLYFTGTSLTSFKVFQIDLSLASNDLIKNSVLQITPTNQAYDISGIQNAPNGKIYVSHALHEYLSEISNPNNKGSLCNYRSNSINLKSRKPWHGLPPLIANYQIKDSTFGSFMIDTCLHQATLIVETEPHKNDANYKWYYEDSPMNLSTSQITVNQSGKYKVIVHIPLDCSDSITYKEFIHEFDIVIPDQLSEPEINLMNPTCGSDNGEIRISITGGTMPYEYSIDNGNTYQSDSVFLGLKEGQYEIVIRDKNGCEFIKTVILNPSENLSIDNVITKNSFCDESNGTIEVIMKDLTKMYSFSIDGSPFQNKNTFSDLGPATYTIVVKDELGCMTMIDVIIIQLEGPEIKSVNIEPSICNLSNGKITVEAKGIPPLSYSIDGANFQSTNTFSNLAPGTYTVTVKDKNGCTVEREVTIKGNDKLFKYSSKVRNVTCNQMNGIIEVVATKEDIKLEYSINGTDYFDEGFFGGLDAGPYTVFIRDEDGCIVEIEFVLIKEDAPIIEDVIIIPATCNESNGELTIVATGGNNISYSLNGSNFTFENKYTNLAPGKYVVVIKDENNCLDSMEVIIEDEGTSFFQDIKIMSTHCGDNNGELTINANGNGLMYSINGSDFEDDNNFSDLAAGVYEIQILDENGCLETRMAQVLDSEGVIIDEIVQTSTLCNQSNGTVRITASGGTGIYTMEVNHTDLYDKLELSNLSKGEYTIEIMDEIGCRADTVLTINQYDCPVYIPNSFSPNGDGINDVFRVFTHENFDGNVKSMSVYDRWGNRIFESNNMDQNTVVGWDGKFNSRELNPGVFVFIIEVENEGGRVEVFKGDLSLVR